MKAQLIIFILFCLILAACEKDVSNVTPQPIDTTVNLVGTWHIDSVLYYSMNLEKNEYGSWNSRVSFNAVDSLKFYNSLKQQLIFRNVLSNDNFFYKLNSPNIIFIKDSLIKTIPLPGWDGIFDEQKINWKQISNDEGQITNLNSGMSDFGTLDKNSFKFKIYRIKNNSILLNLEPFIELTSYTNWCAGLDVDSSLDGYYIKIYLTRIN